MLCENILSALQISNQLGGSRKKVLIPEKTSIENLIRSGFAKQAAQLDLLGIDGAANNLCVAN